MIELYSGTPGSGKSLHAAKLMYDWMHKWKSPVICNFPFRGKACNGKGYGSYMYVNNYQLTPDFLVYFSDTYKSIRKWTQIPEEHILLVVDEAQIIWNARSWQDSGKISGYSRMDWISFFSQHRKLGYRVIMIAQYDMMIDKQIRSLIEYEHIHRKVKNIGIGGKILNLAYGGNLHIDIKVYKPLNEKVGKEFFKANKNICSLYDSYARFDT